MTPARSGLAALISVAFAAPAAAQDAQSLPPVIVSGSRLPSAPSGLAQNVTIIDQRQIQESNPSRIEDVLGRVAGVYVDQAGKTGGFSSLYLRGAENSHLLILIDGNKVNDPTSTRGSTYDLSAIDIAQVERIEVLRGPASAIHGGEALAGVINIVTRRPGGSGLSGDGYAAAGQDGFRRLGGSLAFGTPALRAQVAVGTSRDGSAGSDASLRQNTVAASLRLLPGNGLEGEVFARHGTRKSEAFPDDSGGPRLAVVRQKTLRDAHDTLAGLQASYAATPDLTLQARLTRFERKEHSDNPPVDAGVRDPIPAFVGDSRFRRNVANVTATQRFGAGTSVVLGAEHQSEKGGQDSVFDFGAPVPLPFDLERTTRAVFAEGRWRVTGGVDLQFGIRHDKVTGLDGRTTPHLGAVWALPNGATTLKASYGEGFNPPSFFALGFPIGANPALRPERSKHLELTAVQRLGDDGTELQLNVFRTRYKDLVDFVSDPAAAFGFLNINRGAVVVQGAEPAIRFRPLPNLLAQVNLTLLDIDEKDGRAALRNRPEKRANAALTWDFTERSQLHLAAGYTGPYLDRSNPTGDIRMPGYATVDAAYAIRFGTLTAQFAVDNLFDRDYEQFVGFPARDRRFRVELRTAF